MSFNYFSMLPKVADLLSDQFFYKEFVTSECIPKDENNDFDENVYDLNELEEVFSDHILMGKRLQRTLYRGNIQDLDEDTDHPPIALTDFALKLFSKAVPNYGLDQLDMDYVSSVSEATRVSPCAMILAMIYLERLQIKNSDYLESVSPSGLFVVTMLVASKFLFENEDDVVSNQIWSEALNIDVKELNLLEHKFLSAIDWRIYVDSSEYFQYLSSIEKTVALKQSSLRGWLSYSDVCSILQDTALKKALLICIENILKISTLSTLSYTVTLLSMYAAGLAIQSKCSESNVVSKENLQIHRDIQLQSSFPEISHVVPQPGTKLLVEEPSKLKFVQNIKSVSKDNVFSYVLPNLENLFPVENPAKSTYGLVSHSSLTVENKLNVYISYNLFQHNIVNHTFHRLWSSASFKNTCIPLSIK